MALDGFLFDLDGTLIDSNDTHVEAWLRSFHQHGYHVERDRIFTEIGKGGDKLVSHILGDEADAKRGDELRAATAEAFKGLALERGLPVAPGAVELIAELHRRQLKLALATSSSSEGLAVAERASGVKWRSLMDVVVTASDVAETKPAPDLVQAAVDKLDLTPTQCAMLGDTPWDAQSAFRAGVVLLAVTRGGNPEDLLLKNGARSVYRDPADLLANLDRALRRASPGAAHADRLLLARLMGAALAEAEVGLLEGELPVGCIIADGAGQILASGHDRCNRTRSRLAHAEIETFRRAAGRLPTDPRDMMLICTLEPCVMCVGAAMEAAVDTIVYGIPGGVQGGSNRVSATESTDQRPPRIVGGVRASESQDLFGRWRLRSDRHVTPPMSLSSVMGSAGTRMPVA